MSFAIDVIRGWRGAALRALNAVDPDWLLESTLLRVLHAQGVCPPESELAKVTHYLRGKGLIESNDMGKPGNPLWQHRILPAGVDIAIGAKIDPEIW